MLATGDGKELSGTFQKALRQDRLGDPGICSTAVNSPEIGTGVVAGKYDGNFFEFVIVADNRAKIVSSQRGQIQFGNQQISPHLPVHLERLFRRGGANKPMPVLFRRFLFLA